MSTPGLGAILGSRIIWAKVDFGPTHGQVYRPVNNETNVAAPGPYTVQPFDQLILINKTVPQITLLYLPDVVLWLNSPYGGFDLQVKDLAGNSDTYPISVFPFGASQWIDGLTVSTLPDNCYTIQGNGASVIFRPTILSSSSMGWVTL